MEIKFFKTKKEKNFKKEKESLWLNINFYWKLVVCLMFVMILAASFFGYYLFNKINTETVFSSNDTNSRVDTVSKDRIEKVLKYFSLKQQKSIQILNYSSPVVDPSL